MRFKLIFPVSLVAIGVAMASNFAPAQAENRTTPTLKISCVSSKASDVSCSWTGIPPGFFTRWALLRNDGRAFFTSPSQMSYTDALVKQGATYTYLVWAYNEGVGVARSDSATVLVFGPDAVPTTVAPLEPPKVVVKPTGETPTTTTTTTIEAVKQEISISLSTDTSKPPVTTVTTQPSVTESAKTEPTTPGKTEPTSPPVTIPAPRLPGAPEATHAPATTPTATPTTTPKTGVTSDTKPADSPDATRPPITTPDTKPINKPEATRPPVTTVAPKKTSKDVKSKVLTSKGKSQGLQVK